MKASPLFPFSLGEKVRMMAGAVPETSPYSMYCGFGRYA